MPQLPAERPVRPREWLWAAGASIAIVTITVIPYLVGFAASDEGRVFTGAFYDLRDYASHLAKMWQGYRGSWQFVLLFTSEEHPGGFVHPFYLALGHLARLLGTGLPVAYHLARFLWGVMCLLAAYGFIALFVGEVRLRRMAFLLAALGAGFGWLLLLLRPGPIGGVMPIDFWLSDFYVFFSIFAFPHFPASLGLMLLCFASLVGWTRRPDRVWLLAGGIAAGVAVGFIHPYLMPFVDAVFAAFWLFEMWSKRRLLRSRMLALGIMALAQLPLLGYYLALFGRNPVFAGWTAQNRTPSPPLYHYLLGMGLLGPLAALGLIRLLRAPRRWEDAFPAVWVALALVLAYGPWSFQRRLTEGLTVPLAILAVWGWRDFVEPHLRGGCPAWWLRAAAVAFASVTNLLLMVGFVVGALTGAPEFFYPRPLVEAVDWLGGRSRWDEPVFSAPETGVLVVGRIGHRVVIGHPMETVDYAETKAAVEEFYSPLASPTRKCAILEGYRARFVIYGPFEAKLGVKPAGLPCLREIYHREGVRIFFSQHCSSLGLRNKAW